MKTNFKIYLTCLVDNCNFTVKKNERILVATVNSKGNAYVCCEALKATYNVANWKLTIE